MGVALDQGRSCRIAAIGVKGDAKCGEVGAQLVGNGAGACRPICSSPHEQASCLEAWSSAVGSGLLPVAFCSGSQLCPDAWAMKAS